MVSADIKKILDDIIKETHIISGALDANDIDIVLESLETRKQLIDLVGQENLDTKDHELKEQLDLFNRLNEKCSLKLKANKLALESEFETFMAEKKTTVRTQKTQEKYTKAYDYGISSTFDLKK